MDCTCIRQTDLPGATRLFADLVYHPDRVAPFYSFPPTFEEAAGQIDFPDDRRAALVEALREQNGDSALLAKLAERGTPAIVTGQQVGLFSGPAYTVYKALTAIKLAARYDAVPIFWLATEDHDFAEVNQAWMFNAEHSPSRVATGLTPSGSQPVGEIALGDVPIEALRQAMAGLPYADEIADLAARSYCSGATFGQSFSSLLKELLGPHQILHLDPLKPAVRRLAAPMLREAVDATPELTRALLERNKELEKAGYHAQVHVEDKTSLFFLLENGQRLALRRENSGYVHQARHFSAAELKDRAEQISPNAILRPVIQDFMLPTMAYVGGPAELAYLAQSQVIYQRLLGRQPVAVHRSGFTVLDAHSRKLMNRYGLHLGDFFHGEEALRERIARTLVPPELDGVVKDARNTTAQAMARLKSELARFDSTLAKALNRSARKIEYQVEKIARKTARQALLRDERAARDARSLNGLIFPHRHLQERFYSILPLLAQHGRGLVDDIYEHVQLECPDHQLLTA